MVAIIRDKKTGEVSAVMDDNSLADAPTDDPNKVGVGFAPAESCQEVICRDESEEQFWEAARRSAGGRAERTYVYDSGAIEATTEAPEPPPAPVEEALLKIRAAVDEREGEPAPGHKVLLVEDVDRAIENERARGTEL